MTDLLSLVWCEAWTLAGVRNDGVLLHHQECLKNLSQ